MCNAGYSPLGNGKEDVMKIMFDNYSFVGISIDTYNRKEYVIKSENGAETYFTEKIGNFLSEHYEYATQIFTPSFFEAQKHLKLNAGHLYDVRNVLKVSAPNVISEWETAYDIEKAVGVLYLVYRNDRQYLVAEKDMMSQISLIIEYLNKLYAAGLFPRLCMSCGSLFISGKKHGDVLCSEECRKKKKSQNTMAYYGKLSKNEVLYNNLYRKWKQRIERAEEKQTIDAEGIAQLRQGLKNLIETNRLLANESKAGNISDEDYHNRIVLRDKELYELIDTIKGNVK